MKTITTTLVTAAILASIACGRKVEEAPEPLDARELCKNYCETYMACTAEPIFTTENDCHTTCSGDPIWSDGKHRSCAETQWDALECVTQLSCEEFLAAQESPSSGQCGPLKQAWAGCLAEKGAG